LVELLAPVGDFECLKAAVQNGADAVYFGGGNFNARASAHNFENDELKEAIRYAKLRNVKINFTLNTLLKNEEFDAAIELAKRIYELGCDAVIVQDLGLAKYIIKNLPGMDVHASTQMTIHNLHGVNELERLGFKRVVLSRELPMHEIEYICSHTKLEVETFIHGALCISYSGQCLFSSSVGARSGNRGRCAQPCRLPYDLLEYKNSTYNNNALNDKQFYDSKNYKKVDSGYILSPRDLCGLNYIPRLIKAGVKCFKIEGRMKPPEYVATVTRIYRKYIDLALSGKEYVVDKDDVKALMQVFNRGNFSDGNFSDDPNRNYIYKDKPNNQGLMLGVISAVNAKRGLITLKLKENISIGDKISTEKEDSTKYTVSELMINKENLKTAEKGSIVTIGRLKGNIKPGDAVYKITDNKLSEQIENSLKVENKKIYLYGEATIKIGQPISFEVTTKDEYGTFFSISSKKTLEDIIPDEALNKPLTIDRVREQLSKTKDTQFEFKFIKVILDENVHLPKLAALNELRRQCIKDIEEQAIRRFERQLPEQNKLSLLPENGIQNTQTSVMFHQLNPTFDYSSLENFDYAYVPFYYMKDSKYEEAIKQISSKAKLIAAMPVVLKDNYRNVLFLNLPDILKKFKVKGLLVTNLSCIDFFKDYQNKLEIIANYNLNIYNDHTINILKNAGVTRVTLSPELDEQTLKDLSEHSPLPTELMVYGRLPLMNSGYCLLGKSNRCYPECDMKCRNGNKYFIKDRLGFYFRIIPDNLQTITTIYNSKITSIGYSGIKPNVARVSIIDETIDQINDIIRHAKSDEIFTGPEFTKGNLDKFV
jgi:putative protease